MVKVSVRVDDEFWLYADGVFKKSGDLSDKWYDVNIPRSTHALAIKAYENTGKEGIGVVSDHIWTSRTKFGWRCTDQIFSRTDLSWAQPGYDDSGWPAPGKATIVGALPGGQKNLQGYDYIWMTNRGEKQTIYCRGYRSGEYTVYTSQF